MMARSSHLKVVAGLVEQHVPIYQAGQWDPIIAAREGRGSCFAKNVFGAIILKATNTDNVVTAIQWGDKQHPKLPSGFMLDKTVKRPGHSSLLVGTRINPDRVVALSFNETSHRNDQWRTYDFNEFGDEPYAEVKEDGLVPTEVGVASGISAYPWYEAGQRFTELLDIHDSVFHKMTEEAIEAAVLGCLKSPAVPREIPAANI
jgi:hypothetical protein